MTCSNGLKTIVLHVIQLYKLLTFPSVGHIRLNLSSHLHNNTITCKYKIHKVMKKKILIVDDKTEFRRLTKTILESKYEVQSAENGVEALSILQNGYNPDLIVSDLMMPVLGGKDFLDQVKSSGAFKHIPVIILSSIDKSDEKIKLIKMGANDYIEKPYNPAELLARIENIFKSVAG